MKYPNIMPLVALAAVLAAGPAAAQSSSSPPTSVGAPEVVTDVAPPPAHERDSLGAIVLEDSPVRAQRDRDFEQGAAVKKPRASTVGRKALRSTTKAKTRAELEEAREAEAVELYRRGAAGQIKK